MYIGQTIYENLNVLCDTGSCISCINARLDVDPEYVLPSVCQPVGANGSNLTSVGDVKAHIQLNGIKILERFTRIENLCYDVILGFGFLRKNGFQIIDGTQIKIAGQIMSRVADDGEPHQVHTSIIFSQVNAKILCITPERNDGNSDKDHEIGKKCLTNAQCQKTNDPANTCLSESTTNLMCNAKQKGSDQQTSAREPNLLSTTVGLDELRTRWPSCEGAIDGEKLSSPLASVYCTTTDCNSNINARDRIDIILEKLDFTTLKYSSTREKLEELISSYSEVFSTSD